jgi:hypothetical protein
VVNPGSPINKMAPRFSTVSGNKEVTAYDFVVYPEIYSIFPRLGGARGGSRVTIRGTGFHPRVVH